MSSPSPGSPTEPEYLGESSSEGRRGPRRGVVLGLAAAGVVGVVAAGSWAAVSFLSTGSQPAEAVPADALAYAVAEPFAGVLEQKADEGTKELQCIKSTLLASMQGYAPMTAIEFGRKVLYSTERPSFSELEGHVKGKK